MNNQSRVNYSPSAMLDHVTLEVTLLVKIGLDESVVCDAHALNKNICDAMSAIRSSVEPCAEISQSFFKVHHIDPYCGSLREKLIHDAQYESCGHNKE